MPEGKGTRGSYKNKSCKKGSKSTLTKKRAALTYSEDTERKALEKIEEKEEKLGIARFNFERGGFFPHQASTKNPIRRVFWSM